jgi:crossover junction endodeoxyribonuclease RusA
MTELKFFVAGQPVSQGSMKCVGARGGFHQLIASNKDTLNPWRELVQARAEHAAAYRQWVPLDCAEARLVFRFDRPQSHYRTGRFADLLRDDAPLYPATAIDVDKAIRAIFDALTNARVVTDDAVIVTVTAAKRYATPEHPAGVNVVLSAPAPTQPPLLEVTP